MFNRKIASIVAAASAALVLTSCGSSENDASNSKPDTAFASQPGAESEPAGPPYKESSIEMKQALIDMAYDRETVDFAKTPPHRIPQDCSLPPTTSYTATINSVLGLTEMPELVSWRIEEDGTAYVGLGFEASDQTFVQPFVDEITRATSKEYNVFTGGDYLQYQLVAPELAHMFFTDEEALGFIKDNPAPASSPNEFVAEEGFYSVTVVGATYSRPATPHVCHAQPASGPARDIGSITGVQFELAEFSYQ